MNRNKLTSKAGWYMFKTKPNAPFTQAYWYGSNQLENASYTPLCKFKTKVTLLTKQD